MSAKKEEESIVEEDIENIDEDIDILNEDITNGENENIYLESDYAAFDHATMEDDIVNYEESKRDVIKEIEDELAQRRAIADDILA